jgi:glycerophosphoryl diester phosphodiesterase
VYAHRGGSALRPENTHEAFEHGLSHGADGLEFDVHLSRDGVVVVHHDATLERTTDGRGPIGALTASELAEVDAGFRFSTPDGNAPFRGRRLGVPVLRDVLSRYPGIPLIIELKQPGEELARHTIEEVRRANAVDRVVLGSFY